MNDLRKKTPYSTNHLVVSMEEELEYANQIIDIQEHLIASMEEEIQLLKNQWEELRQFCKEQNAEIVRLERQIEAALRKEPEDE